MKLNVFAAGNWPKGWNPTMPGDIVVQAYGTVLSQLVKIHPGCISNERLPNFTANKAKNEAMVDFLMEARNPEHAFEIKNCLESLLVRNDLRYSGDWTGSDESSNSQPISQQPKAPAMIPTLLEETHLHKMFGEPTPVPCPGRGGKYMVELVTYWNKRDYEKSLELLNAAISAGLEGYDKSTAHCMRGQIYIRQGKLPSAIDDFLECLSIPDRAMDQTWQAAKRLEYIYSEAGRYSEAAKLDNLARLANEMNWQHTPSVESELREMTRRLINNDKLTV